MRRISTFITALLLSVAPAAARSVTGPVPCAAPIHASVGSTFVITLPSNRTTGYSWAIDDPLNSAVVAYRGKKYVTPKTGLVGAPGMEVWTFTAAGRGHALISFKYARPGKRMRLPQRRRSMSSQFVSV